MIPLDTPDNILDNIPVDIFVDPICPFAWLTSRWLGEVERVRPVTATIRIMSLSVLNDGREGLSDFYRDLITQGWGPARVAVAVENEHGSEGLSRFYDAFGNLHHVQRTALGPRLLTESLTTAGLPTRHADAADRTDLDDALRATHHRGMDPVGTDVGTPILHIHLPGASEPTTIFGPVVTPAPRGESAGALWDGVLAVSSCGDFFELKRSRTRPLEFS